MNKLLKNLLLSIRPNIVFLLLPLSASAQPVLELVKKVDNPVPMQNEPVEFSIEVTNVGDEAALEVQVEDLLPPELVIPPGMAAFTSSGSYDADSGVWSVGDLDPEAGSIMTLPAILAVDEQPACIVNIATASFAGGGEEDETSDRAAVRQTGTEQCVDLDVAFGISVGNLNPPGCDVRDRYHGDVTVTNHGPDAARMVAVTISQNPVFGPNLRFDDADCINTPAARCDLGTIAAGESLTIDVTSDLFQSHEVFEQTISVLAVTTDVEYEPSNNDRSDFGSAGGFSSCAVPDFGVPGAGPGCFIATAAWGSALSPHVGTLRKFRDRYLMTHRGGRIFVDFYYRHSPPIAQYIAVRPGLRAVVRWLLTPLVFAIAYPAAAVAVLGLSGTVLVVRRRRRYDAPVSSPI